MFNYTQWLKLYRAIAPLDGKYFPNIEIDVIITVIVAAELFISNVISFPMWPFSGITDWRVHTRSPLTTQVQLVQE